MSFPDSFVWGAAAASYQIEGAHDADGKGLSIWDHFTHTPGKIWNRCTGDRACDHYHRYADDVALMKQIGLQAYRLSISWPRILPQGTGQVNQAGIDFYNRLIDTLLEAGIQPYATLFHWDFPLALYYKGGWLNREVSHWFEDYTRIVVDALSDRVSHWMTLNEPQVFIGLGHSTGEHAPGLKLPTTDILLAAHHGLMAHGRAVEVIRNYAKTTPTIGWAPVGTIRYPGNDEPKTIELARQSTFTIDHEHWNNTWFSDPVCLGQYPEQGLSYFGNAVPRFPDADLRVICQPLDFYGVNIYHGMPVLPTNDGGWTFDERTGEGYPITCFHWPVTPEALYWGPKFLYERYKLPVYITENGLSCHDWVAVDGKVHDPNRIDFTTRYLRHLKQACADGVDVRGYFHWSIMDNFEWAEGYRHRFGLIHVDYQTLKRTPKDSAQWYAKVIQSNGDILP